jgi:hypothetical protein
MPSSGYFAWRVLVPSFGIAQRDLLWNHLQIRVDPPELGTRFFLRFALALSRSFAELFALALKFRAFAFAL